jgi:hypothetical protein
MPWQLTTPVNVGDLDEANYDQVKITKMVHDARRKMIRVTLEYGRTVDDVWVPGKRPAGKTTSVLIKGDDYTTLVTTSVTETDELTYDATKRGLYDWLSANGVIDAGSVV